MLDDFIKAHLPSGSAESKHALCSSYLTMLPSIDIESSALMRNAVEALCLAHMGNTRQDDRLIRAAQVSYGRVLASLRQAMARPVAKGPRGHEVLASILLVSLYDNAMPVEHRSDTAWMTHYNGAQAYVHSCRFTTFDLDNPFDQRVLKNLWQCSYVLSIVRRTALDCAKRKWSELLDSFNVMPYQSWFTRVLRLPGILAEVDSLINETPFSPCPRHQHPRPSPTSLDESSMYQRDPQSGATEACLAILCRELDDMHTSIEKWMKGGLKEPTSIPITDLDAFDPLIEEHAFLLTSDVFPTHHAFPDGVLHVQDASMVWFTLLVITCTQLRILHLRPSTRQLFSRGDPNGVAAIERDAVRRASDLCRSTHAYSRFGSLAWLHFGQAMLGFARNVFDEAGAGPEAAWCRACLAAAAARLRRLRSSAPRRTTLCRLGDMVDLLGASGRYRAKAFSEIG